MQKVVQRLENPAPPRIGFKEKRHRQSFAPSVTTAALLNRNTSGKTTHTPQLKALRLDNPSLQKASRHE
jgi:hypothetical protein